MTKQLTIKLNEERFKPLIEELAKSDKLRLSQTYSELVAKSLFLCYNLMNKDQPDESLAGPDQLQKQRVLKSREVLDFMNSYAVFKRQGMTSIKKKD
jgi:hypothetical protein